jgi:hypothetical protein
LQARAWALFILLTIAWSCLQFVLQSIPELGHDHHEFW